MFEKIVEAIKRYDTIIIHRHNNPDGDAAGSQVGLKHLITANYPDKAVYMVGDAPGRYGFMAESEPDCVSNEKFSGALCVILDCGSPSMISDDRYGLADYRVRIDHHLFCGKIADEEVIDSSFESCCGMVGYMAMESGWKLDLIAAQSLYTGMVTDSGRFRYDSTTHRTFEIAAYLMSLPIDLTSIYGSLYAEDFEAVRRRAEFVLKIRFSENNVAYIYNTAEEVAASGMSTFSVSRGMVGTMADIRGVDIWVNFTEAEEGVFCELRSSKYNINPVAVKYGGGGHAKASGATVADRETAMSMLKELDDMAAGER